MSRFLAGAVRLLGPALSFHDGIHGLEMARVGHECDLDHVPIRRLEPPARAVMILDIPRAPARCQRFLDLETALELGKQRFVRHPEYMGQNVQSTTMCHAHDCFPRALLRSEIERAMEHGNEHVETLDAEALVPEVVLVEKRLERLDSREV